jgi:hypothetical protein
VLVSSVNATIYKLLAIFHCGNNGGNSFPVGRSVANRRHQWIGHCIFSYLLRWNFAFVSYTVQKLGLLNIFMPVNGEKLFSIFERRFHPKNFLAFATPRGTSFAKYASKSITPFGL